ncbi:MAG: glycosyltransferase family 2 protein [candidate division Zixibacteria bacterium]|nr:glycosyltransferase family 2 protein [candidate division Zixibacteria bacterium]
MELAVLILKAYVIFEVSVLIVYTIRHIIFTHNRVSGEQRMYYQDIIDAELPFVSVMIPMRNEESVADDILSHLIAAEYPRDKIEIIPIDDHSEDKTKQIINKYAQRNPDLIKPFHRDNGHLGKTHGLNEALAIARGEIILLFDADYVPPKGIVKDIAVSFKDPEVGAVMGRVIPHNTPKNFLTRILDLERSAGYQVDQQARHNMKLIPQFGGTVGGFRKDVVIALGGFNTKILAEDTELTFLLFIHGWKVVYANRAECFEEVPESWGARTRQISRWARGHTQVMLRYWFPVLISRHLSFKEKLDGILLLNIFVIPLIIFWGIPVALALFFLGEMNILESILIFLIVATYNSFGNFAPFYQIGTASYLDGTKDRIKLLPLFFFSFIFNIVSVSKGSSLAFADVMLGRTPKWQKTKRYRNNNH